MNWKTYFNTNAMITAKNEINHMSFWEATKFIRKKYRISLHDSIDFAKAFSR